MRILTFSDLHLGDHRKSMEEDIANLDNLHHIASKTKPDVIVNSGDTVSKDVYLRNLDKKLAYWEHYLAVKNSISCPIIETCLTRERDFFTKLFNTEHQFSVVKGDYAFISIAPVEDSDHTLNPHQLAWLTAEIKKLSGKIIIFNSHVSIAQTTVRRAEEPGIYLSQSRLLKKLAERYAKFTIFLGGHFHVPPETPRQTGNILMLMSGCYDISSSQNANSYFRIIDIDPNKIAIATINSSLQNILPRFTTIIQTTH